MVKYNYVAPGNHIRFTADQSIGGGTTSRNRIYYPDRYRRSIQPYTKMWRYIYTYIYIISCIVYIYTCCAYIYIYVCCFTSKVISGWAPNYDSAHSCWLYSAVPLRDRLTVPWHMWKCLYQNTTFELSIGIASSLSDSMVFKYNYVATGNHIRVDFIVLSTQSYYPDTDPISPCPILIMQST